MMSLAEPKSSQPMPTIFRREWDDGDFSSWQAMDAGRNPASSNRPAMTLLGRALAAVTPRSRMNVQPLIDCADRFSENKQGNKMKNIAQRAHHRLTLPVGR
jgi:hypothetical protein